MSEGRDSIFSLAGKTALLTGATGFLGRSMARALLIHGAGVVLLGRSDRLQEQTRSLAEEFGKERITARQVDMYEREQYEAVLGETLRASRIDVLVNNAFDFSERTGFNTPRGRFEQSTYEQWMSCYESGLWWAACASRIVGLAMQERGAGSIVNIATMYAVVAPDPALYEDTTYLNPPGYSASKAAMLAMTRYVASFLGPHGVRANAILPGPFSNVGGDSYNAVPPENPFLGRLVARTALKRLGQPHELEGALVFLASDASSFITGQALLVDGGWTVT